MTTGGVLGSFRLDGWSAAATGAARGIGRVIAHGLAEASARLAVADIDFPEASVGRGFKKIAEALAQ